MVKPALKYLVPGVWLVLAAGSMGWLARVTIEPGARKDTPRRWPADSSVARAAKEPTLLMFAHPKCPCTRASLENLNRLLAKCPASIKTTVLFLSPSSEGADWPETDSWRSAASIPGVTVQADRDGKEAGRFGAETSGYVVVYSAEGKLIFAGGITESRGHAGDNEGGETILQMLSGKTEMKPTTPVFGCELVKSCPTKL